MMTGYHAAKRKVPLKFKLLGGIVRTRHPALLVVLTTLTLGFYAFYWLHEMGAALHDAIGDEREIRPTLETILNVCTFGLFGLWLMVRNARKIHATSLYFRRSHRDLSPSLIWLTFFAPFTFGLTLFVAMVRLQEQVNSFSRLADERTRARSAGSVSTPSLERKVMLKPMVPSRIPAESERSVRTRPRAAG